MKQITSAAFALLLACLLLPPVAATRAAPPALPELDIVVDRLHMGGFFLGTDNGYELNVVPDRSSAAVAFVRMLGKEEFAKNDATAKPHPFTDVPSWADPYVTFMYHNGYTKGVSATLFGAKDLVTGPQFYTFVLRALGYRDGTDFQYAQAVSFAADMGITGGTAAHTELFLRGDMAVAMLEGLLAVPKGADAPLIRKLQKEGAVQPYIADIIEGKNEVYNFFTAEVDFSAQAYANYSSDRETLYTFQDAGTTTSVSRKVVSRHNTDYEAKSFSIYTEISESRNAETTEVRYYISEQGSFAWIDGQWRLHTNTADAEDEDPASINRTALLDEMLSHFTLRRENGKVIISGFLRDMDAYADSFAFVNPLSTSIQSVTYTEVYDEQTGLQDSSSLKMSAALTFDSVVTVEMTRSQLYYDYGVTTITPEKELQDLINAL